MTVATKLILLGFLASLPGSVLSAQGADPPARADRIAARLVAHGFENVAVEDTGETVTVWFENRVYRYDLPALGAVAWLAGSEILEESVLLELVPENRNVALISLAAPTGAWLSFLKGETDPGRFRDLLAIRGGRRAGGGPLSPRGLARRNRSYFRTDVQVRPLFDFNLGVADDPFEYTLRLAPEAVMSPFPGGLFTLQAAVRIHDDLDPCGDQDPCGPVVLPERNTLSWAGWIPGNWLLASSAGLFPGDRWGVATEVGRLFFDGQLEVWGGGDLSGRLQFLDEVIEYSNLNQWSAFVAFTHRFRGLDLETTLTGGRFREEEIAVRLEVARRFQEFEIGFFSATNENDTISGVNLRVALPVRRYLKPTAVRPSTVPEFPFSYRSSVNPVAVQVSLYDNLDRMRKRLYPTFIWNNVLDMRRAMQYLEGSGS